MAIDHYSELFSVNVLHTFYNDGKCYDFSLEPTERCRAYLRGHRLITKETGNGLSVIAPCDASDTPFLSLSEGLTFSFLMKLENRELDGFTDLPSLSDGYVYHFDNSNATAVGTWELTQGEVLLSSVEREDYTQVFALIEIGVNSSFPSVLSSSSTFTVSFSGREEIWKYYLVVGSDDDWSVVDADSVVTFTETDLSISDPTGDRVAELLKSDYPDYYRYLFESDQVIAYQSDGRKNLQLKKDTDTIIEHLPNPSFLKEGVRIIKMI